MLLFCSYIVLFAYARATAAMAVYYWGVSFLCKPIRGYKWLSYIFGLIIIYFSWEFHNSAIIMILITIILFLPINKWTIALVLISLPVIISISKDYFLIIENLALDNYEEIGERMSRHTKTERAYTYSQAILSIFRYPSIYIPVIISTITLFIDNKFRTIPTHIIRLYKVTFGIVLAASVLYLFGPAFNTMFYRVLFMAMIPVCLIITTLYKEGYISKKQFKWCYMPGLIFCILSLTYDIYDIYINA
jgi:hypothetical protein